jgi:hypothetical protein
MTCYQRSASAEHDLGNHLSGATDDLHLLIRQISAVVIEGSVHDRHARELSARRLILHGRQHQKLDASTAKRRSYGGPRALKQVGEDAIGLNAVTG